MSELRFWETREHGHLLLGNKREIKLGTREPKHIFGNREHQNRRNTFREHGNTKKILLVTREHGPPPTVGPKNSKYFST